MQSSIKNLQNPKILQEYMNKLRQLQSQCDQNGSKQVSNERKPVGVKTSNSPKQLMAQFSPKGLTGTNSLFSLQKQQSEKSLVQQKSLNSIKLTQIPTPTDRSTSTNRKVSPYIVKDQKLKQLNDSQTSRKLSYLQTKRMSTQAEDQGSRELPSKPVLKSGSNTPKFTSEKQRTLFGSADIDISQMAKTVQPKQDRSPRDAPQDWNEIKRQLNIWFINESKTNNTGGCLQLLEPTLVHNLRKTHPHKHVKLPSQSPINPDLRASISAKDVHNNTALHYAAKNGNTQLCSALIFKQIEVDPINKDYMTPIMLAACYGRDEVLLILLNAGADVNQEDSLGNTPLHYAAKNGHRKAVQILLKRYSIIYDKRNNEAMRPEDLASTEEIKLLFKEFGEEYRKKQLKQNRVQIQQAQTDLVQKMFQLTAKPKEERPKIGSLHTSRPVEKNVVLSASGNSNSTNSDSFPAEEAKVSPQQFQVLGMIGKGSFGEVYLVQKKDLPQSLFAMKVLHKNRIMKHNLTRYALTERNVLSVTAHPFIVKLRYAFQTSDKLFMILDYCPGGDLGELLQKQKRLQEDLVKMYLCEILLALEDLHKRDVIFRDLKPDNIVMDAEGHVLLTDFGLSKEGILEPNTGARSFCGSVAYLAPEMLKRCGHGKAVDWYLFGVVMYELIVGLPPYYANNREELFHNIENAPLKMPAYISAEGKSLLKAVNLLQRNPAKRLGSGKGDAEEIKAHPYFKGVNWLDIYNRKQKLPTPQRKIRINTRLEGDVFLQSDVTEMGNEHLKGWSFVNQEKPLQQY